MNFLASTVAALTLLATVLAAPLAAQEGEAPRVWHEKLQLDVLDGPASDVSPALCTIRYLEGTSELSILCSHRFGSAGDLSLVHAGAGARSESPLWSAPLASPFEAIADLSDDAVTTLLAGELALRIDTGAGGIVAEGSIGTPIFSDGFDIFSMCRWSNFPCPSDGNVCTDELCSSTGVCSQKLNTLPCDLPGASGGCFLGGCIITSCDNGYSNCDVTNANGCEVNHDSGPGACSTLVNFVGSYTGDTVCGPGGCFLNFDGYTFATRTGRGEAFFSADVLENSACDASIEHSLELIVPPDVDYDLFVYRNCQLVGSSILGTGQDEFLRIQQEDVNVGPDSFYYQVEVKWFSGRSCEEWELKFSGLTC